MHRHLTIKLIASYLMLESIVYEVHSPTNLNGKRTCDANPAGENSLFIFFTVSDQFHFTILSFTM